MIGFIKGRVVGSFDSTVVLENNGIGYEINCSASAFCRLLNEKEGIVYTYLQVKEDGLALFGFDSVEEKRMFLKLISVSGIGAKSGVAVLGSMSLSDLAMAIATSDVKTLSKVKGVGKKTAERIIVELRESFSSEKIAADVSAKDGSGVATSSEGENAVMALMSLGYDRSTSSKAVSYAVSRGADKLETIISDALRSLA